MQKLPFIACGFINEKSITIMNDDEGSSVEPVLLEGQDNEDVSTSIPFQESSRSPQPNDYVEAGTKRSNSRPVLSADSTGTATLIADEDIMNMRMDLQESLQEEQRLISLQVQLVSQLETWNSSIVSAQSDESRAKLAIQQAQILRLMKKTQDPDTCVNDETITI